MDCTGHDEDIDYMALALILRNEFGDLIKMIDPLANSNVWIDMFTEKIQKSLEEDPSSSPTPFVERAREELQTLTIDAYHESMNTGHFDIANVIGMDTVMVDDSATMVPIPQYSALAL